MVLSRRIRKTFPMRLHTKHAKLRKKNDTATQFRHIFLFEFIEVSHLSEMINGKRTLATDMAMLIEESIGLPEKCKSCHSTSISNDSFCAMRPLPRLASLVATATAEH